MADGHFTFLSFIHVLGPISNLIACFQANLALLIPQADYSGRRQNITGYRFQEAEGWISL